MGIVELQQAALAPALPGEAQAQAAEANSADPATKVNQPELQAAELTLEQKINSLKVGQYVVVSSIWGRLPKYLNWEWTEVLEIKRKTVKVPVSNELVVTPVEQTLPSPLSEGHQQRSGRTGKKAKLTFETKTVVAQVKVRPVYARQPHPNWRSVSEYIVRPRDIYVVETEERYQERKRVGDYLRLIRDETY